MPCTLHFLESIKHTVILWHMMFWELTFRLSANQIQPDIKLFNIYNSLSSPALQTLLQKKHLLVQCTYVAKRIKLKEKLKNPDVIKIGFKVSV